MLLREYCPTDCLPLSRLFYQTVHAVNARDYTPEQLDAWADGRPDLVQWNRRLLSNYTLVAEEGGELLGFGGLCSTGLLDHLFVHKDHQGQGVASALCDQLEARCGVPSLTAHVSRTALPFFQGRGYHILEERTVDRQGVALTQFVLEKNL